MRPYIGRFYHKIDLQHPMKSENISPTFFGKIRIAWQNIDEKLAGEKNLGKNSDCAPKPLFWFFILICIPVHNQNIDRAKPRSSGRPRSSAE